MILLNTSTRKTDMRNRLMEALQIESDRTDLHGRLDAVMELGCELVNKRAPDAPDAVAREALIRIAGWALQSGAQIDYSHAGMVRRSGAAGLLKPWTTRRAGAIKRAAD